MSLINNDNQILNDQRPQGKLIDYISIARPDHFIKHIFVAPGIILAIVLRVDHLNTNMLEILSTFSVCALSASANYVMNEWLDAPRDKYHPNKSSRPCVSKKMNTYIIWTEYAVLALLALWIGLTVSILAFSTASALLISGIVYNVPPIRTKDIAIVDVLSESINNPIRLIFGWIMMDSTSIPPASFIVIYWMGGAFLMNTKRLAEFREVITAADLVSLRNYRNSFKKYSHNNLILLSFFYGLMTLGLLGIFIVKYRIEYILLLPLISGWFTIYLNIGLKANSTAQAPERLYREHYLIAIILLTIIVALVLSFTRLTLLEDFTRVHYYSII